MNITKTGIVNAIISENLPAKKLSDGSVWACIFLFDYDIANSVFTTTTAKECNENGKFSCLGRLNEFVPSDGWYEFYYTESRTDSKFIRWKQSYNPLSRVTGGNSGTSSEYVFISGTASSSFYGLTRYTSDDSASCYLRGYPSWWGAIAPYQTSYDVFPSMWGGSTGNHFQSLWIRIDNISSTPQVLENAKTSFYSTSVLTRNLIEY